MPIRLTDLYAGTAQSSLQDVSQPASPSGSTAPEAQPKGDTGMGQHAVTISWLGIVIALVLLRVIYEVSE